VRGITNLLQRQDGVCHRPRRALRQAHRSTLVAGPVRLATPRGVHADRRAQRRSRCCRLPRPRDGSERLHRHRRGGRLAAGAAGRRAGREGRQRPAPALSFVETRTSSPPWATARAPGWGAVLRG
jgi:hypothetical protein